ncbi:MAG: protein serine/threonine phosphatase with GAF(s) sensor(s) [Deltaproteobacteria bacterium]|nr:protein serine/threonine phosphatase with GAF(s) sensor(s) [Deltaproteobacteria bacterium]
MSGVHFDIDQEVVFVGRSPGNDVRIPDEAVSRRHLKIFSVESCYFIEDLKTKNGTLINGEALDAGFARLVTENDRIQLGSSVIRLDGIGVNKPPITVEEIEPQVSEKTEEPGDSKAYQGEERRSRVFKEMNFIYDLLQPVGKKSSTNQLLQKVTEFLFESYPRIDRVSAFLFDDEKGRMEEVVSRSKQDPDRRRSQYTKAILDQVVQEGKIVTVLLKADATRDGFTDDLDTVAVMAVICVPLMTGEKVRGAINIEGFRESNPLRKEDFLLMKTIKSVLELSLQRGDRSEAPQGK